MSQFWIDVYNAADVKQNAHTQDVSGVRITTRINQIGEMEFSMPAAVATQIGAGFGMKYRLYHEALGDLGKFKHYDSTTDADQKLVTIKCYDSLVEPANRVAGFARQFVNQPFASIAAALMNPFGVDQVYESGFDQSQVLPSMEFQGELVLRALDYLRQYVRGYFRRNSDTEMAFGDFSATVPVVRLYSPSLAYAEAGGDYATITALKRERRGTGVVNRVFPFGAGVGETVVDLRYSTRTAPYTILHGAPYSGSDEAWFIGDAASITAYGVVDRVLTFTDVRPLTNSAADLENAANAVYDLSAAYLQKTSQPIDAYLLSCLNLPLTTRVGDLIRVDYAGVATLEDESVAWLTLVNQKYFITEISREFGDSGNPISQLTVSTNGEEIVGTTEVFSSLLGDVGSLKLRVQPTMCYFTKSSPTQPMEAATSRWAQLKWFFGLEVLAVNEMKVEFRLDPLRTYAVSSVAENEGNSDTAVDPISGDPSDATTEASDVSIGGDLVHSHVVGIGSPAGGVAVYLDEGIQAFTANTLSGHSELVPTGTATLDLHSQPHTHEFSHVHPIPHTHDVVFGITDDTQNLAGVTVYVNGVGPIGGIIDADTGLLAGGTGASATGPGYFYVDILDTLLAGGDFRNKTHTIEFRAVGNRGQLFSQLLSRVTIQPIAAS
jgi:hypothetical protein